MGRSPLLRTLFFAVMVSGCLPTCKPTHADLARHQVRSLAFWERYGRPALTERVREAPAEIIDYLTMDNLVNGFEGEPSTMALTPELKSAIAAAFAGLPPRMTELLAEKLLGIFVAEQVGSSAYTDFVRDERGYPVAAFIILDKSAISRTGNDWLTWKESSPFKADPRVRIEGVLSEPDKDAPQVALNFLLFHEFAHVIAIDEDVHPDWSASPKAVDLADYPFTELSWHVAEGRYARKVEIPASLSPNIVYYKPSMTRPSATLAPLYYDWLITTDFVTLYAATSPFDDFADAVATYLHTERLDKPFEIRIYVDDEPVRTIRACWREPRCRAKREVLEKFLRLEPR